MTSANICCPAAPRRACRIAVCGFSEVASGSITRKYPRGDGIGGGLPVGNGLADRNDEFVEWVFENDGVLTQGDGLSTVVDGDVFFRGS